MLKAKEKGRRSSTLYKGKSAARQGTGRRYSKRSEENIQNTERSMDRHRNRKDGYAQRHNSKSAPKQWCNRDIYGSEDGSKIWI